MLFYIKDWAYRPLFSNFAAQKSQNKQHIMDNIKTQVARELLLGFRMAFAILL